MMRVLNPNFQTSGPADRAALIAYLQSVAGSQHVDFDAIRANVAGLAGASDGQVSQVAQDAGLTVMP